MTQIQQLGFLANNLTVNTAANTATITNALVVGNSSVNVVVNSSSVYVSGSPLGGAINTAAQFTFTNVHIHTANVSVNGAIIANGSSGTAGQALISGGAGNTYWGVSSPGYNYSSQFNGSNQYLSNASASVANFGTGDFTFECWVYFTAMVSSSYYEIFSTSGSAGGFQIYKNNTSAAEILVDNIGSAIGSFGTGFLTNQWYHIAISRSGTSLKTFVNGGLINTYTNSTNFSITGAYIGAFPTPTSYFPGFISNLRIVKGTAVYTSAFTPPTSPLSAISGTSLLVCNAITPTSDSSTNNFQINNNNGVTTTATTSPFTSTTVSIPTSSLTAVRQQFVGDGTTTTFSIAGGYTPNAISVFVTGVLYRNGSDVTVTNGSTIVFATAPLSGALIDVIGTVPTTYSSITPVGYSASFNGSQYLTIPDNTAFDFGAGNFTIEFWINLNSAVAFAGVFVKRTSNANFAPFTIAMGSDGKTLTVYASTSGSSWTISPSVSLLTGSWYHVAIVRNSTTFTLYLNGINVATATASGALMTNSAGLAIGSDQTAAGGNMINGYISNMRVVKGVAVYTAPFFPVGPLTAVQTATATQAAITGTQTSLLTCNGPTIIDGSTNAFTITNNGTATVSTSIVPTFTNVTITSNTAGGLSLASTQTANFTASTGFIYPINTTSGVITVTLPATPSPGQFLQFIDYAGTWQTNFIVVSPNGNKINSSTSNFVLSNNREAVTFFYVDSTQGWLISGGVNAESYTISYLVVAGGGAGGYDLGGGGGAGGMLTGTTKVSAGSIITATVGGGGGANGGNGGNSILSTSAATITSIGGGGGSNLRTNGKAGGSGGGAGGDYGNYSSFSGGAGTAGQGNNGGGAERASVNSTSGGGGGAGSVGGTGLSATVYAGAGGAGLASSITGTSVLYAGGGGGGLGGVAGSGGGATGGSGYGGTGGTATVNTGGGGGGGSGNFGNGGNGGSGIVIISVPTVVYTGVTTGSPTVTTSGSRTIISFTSSGTYTA